MRRVEYREYECKRQELYFLSEEKEYSNHYIYTNRNFLWVYLLNREFIHSNSKLQTMHEYVIEIPFLNYSISKKNMIRIL